METQLGYFLSAEINGIAGIDEDLIQRFAIILYDYSLITKSILNILKNIACQRPEDLSNCTIVIGEAILPIGELSEEAQEAKDKDIRKYRDAFTTKVNLKRLSSDIRPFILIHENDDGNDDENDDENGDKNDDESEDDEEVKG
ncbi:unnamed protein product [Brassicogethes aeneus]|uniref:Uncharacterized protein n=1 Tax=Brassicogethes aeneus TaxID=1431903 RepID=A0A9P0B4H8_BRAAE|nr:unnamed protein product [Brassicogethes aeneus]